MSPDKLIEAIRAADIGPFREVRLITLVHTSGATPEVVKQVIEELKTVNEEEKRELDALKGFLDSLSPEMAAFKELDALVKKAAKQLAATDKKK